MKELTKAEEQIMRVLWRMEKCFIRDIVSELSSPKPAYNTVATFLKILEKKGFVERTPMANTYQYSPLIKRRKYTEYFMKSFAERFFDGSVKGMMSFFIDKGDMSISEMEELQKLIKQKKK